MPPPPEAPPLDVEPDGFHQSRRQSNRIVSNWKRYERIKEVPRAAGMQPNPLAQGLAIEAPVASSENTPSSTPLSSVLGPPNPKPIAEIRWEG